jgi:dihydropyrimidinase
MLDTKIINGEIVNSWGITKGEIGIREGKIVMLADKIPEPATETIDAKGRLVMPGAIDVHVHFQLPFCGTVSADDFENGTKAAACGGVTTVIDFAVQKKGGTLKEAVESRRAEAEGKVAVDYGLHAVPTDWNERTRGEMRDIVDMGIPTFKMFMIYEKEGMMSDDAALFQGLEEVAELGGMMAVHAESAKVLDFLVTKYHDPEVMKKYGAYCHSLSRPNFVEAEAVQRAVTWAEATGGALYIVHMSTEEAADIVQYAQANGLRVYAETCPHYLLLNDELFKGKNGHLYATCPQIKEAEDSERLWEGLIRGEISVISTDTCTFTTKQKAMWEGDFTKIPYGLPGVETLLPLMYTYGVGQGRFPVTKLVELVSTNPARLMGMYPEKGTIAVGSEADVVIFDPKREVTISHKNLQTNCDWSPYEGFQLRGYPQLTMSRGKIVAREGRFIGDIGWGKFVKRHLPTF